MTTDDERRLQARLADLDPNAELTEDEWDAARAQAKFDFLREALGHDEAVIVGDDLHVLTWLAGWDVWTVARVANLFRLAREGRGTYDRAGDAEVPPVSRGTLHTSLIFAASKVDAVWGTDRGLAFDGPGFQIHVRGTRGELLSLLDVLRAEVTGEPAVTS